MRRNLMRTIFTLSLTMLSVSAHASAGVYRVWYYDDDFNTYDPGDFSVGWVKVIPPWWACSIKIYWPDHYDSVGDYAVSLDSGDLNQHVTVSLPRPGCPLDGAANDENGGIVAREGNTLIPFALGTHYLEIMGSEDFAFNWLDENGSNHACGYGCATPPSGFKYVKAKYAKLDGLGHTFDRQGTMLLLPAVQKVREAAARMKTTLAALDAEVRVQIAIRRRSNLGEWEAGVRALEDAALAMLSEAGRRIADLDFYATQQNLASAYVSADLGSESIIAASDLLRAAESSFPPRVQ
jgi:hypothetical protein